MNIFEAKEAKIKAYLKFLSRKDATSPKKAVRIEEVEGALKVENRLFDEITRYLQAEGLIKKSMGTVYLTKAGAAKG